MLVKVVLIVTVFFFKQKTAYEMRISDWSSDVCSSDLTGAGWISGADPGLYCRARVVHSSRSARGACMDIAELLAFSVKNKASDLHLSAGLPPMIRVDGDVRRLNIPALDHKQVHALVYDIMSDTQRRADAEFLEDLLDRKSTRL